MSELEHELRWQLDAAARSVPGPGSPPSTLVTRARRRRRRRAAVGGAVLLVLFVAAAGIRPPADDEGQLVDTSRGLQVASELHLDRTVLPGSPLNTRRQASGIWTGTEFVVWGGTGARNLYADGAAYDPRTGRWRTIAPGPLTGRTGHVAAWTGREMIVWGGTTTVSGTSGRSDGAAYDPAADRWRPIAAAPEGRAGAEAVLVDGVVVIGAGASPQGGTFDGLLVYDVAADSWSRIETEHQVIDLTAAGDAVVAATLTTDRTLASIVRYDLERGRTTRLPPLAEGTAVDTLAVAATGSVVTVLAGTTESVVVLLQDGDGWREVADARFPHLYVDTGAFYPSPAAAWIHRGWLVVSGPAGIHAASLDDGDLAESGFDRDACGAEAAVAAAPDAVYVFGGQNCGGSAGGGTTAEGWRIHLDT